MEFLATLGDMPLSQKVTTITVASALLLLVLELVRTRKLREEYSWLWILTALGLLGVILWFDALKFITLSIGAGSTSSTIFFIGHIFLVLVCIQFSVRLSRLTENTKNLAQKITLLEAELESLRNQKQSPQPNPVNKTVCETSNTSIELDDDGEPKQQVVG